MQFFRGEKNHCICYPLVYLLSPGCDDKEDISDSEHQALVSRELLINLPQPEASSYKEGTLAAVISGKAQIPKSWIGLGSQKKEKI